MIIRKRWTSIITRISSFLESQIVNDSRKKLKSDLEKFPKMVNQTPNYPSIKKKGILSRPRFLFEFR